MVCTEAVLLSSTIDAEERRDVAVVDVPNAFIQTRVEDEKDMAIIRVRGLLVDILLELAPEFYSEYVTVDRKGNKQLILQCQNTIYGTMVASLLFYRKFCKTLVREGFKCNPYDPCVWNRMVKGKQQTVLFHVDDCKISCVSVKANDDLIETLRQEYESIFEDGSGKMKVHRGKVLEYLGMTLDYSVDGQVKITMLGYIKECIELFEKMAPNKRGSKSSAAPKNLFVVDDNSKKLSDSKREQFHSLVAKMLFATKHVRPDTGTTMSFLTTRVSEPDVDDWKKLAHLMRYIRGTKELPLILSANSGGMLKWWVDGSHGVHPNM